MSERPWLEGGDPSLRVERALLKRLNAQQPPVGSAEHGWAALSAEISGAGLLAPTHAAHAAKAAGLGAAGKVVASVAVAGGLLWGGSVLVKSDASSSVNPRAPSSLPAERPLGHVRAPDAAISKPAQTPAVSASEPAAQARSSVSTTSLAEEGRLLGKAHQLILSGHGREALEVLRASAARYPRSALSQEREVLSIEALSSTGDSGAARQRAERFLKRYPSSPHADRLQRFVE